MSMDGNRNLWHTNVATVVHPVVYVFATDDIQTPDPSTESNAHDAIGKGMHGGVQPTEDD